jgi:hypothetical protein
MTVLKRLKSAEFGIMSALWNFFFRGRLKPYLRKQNQRGRESLESAIYSSWVFDDVH